MWTPAGTLNLRQYAAGGLVLLLLSLLLLGCGSGRSITRAVLAGHCMRIDGHHESNVSLQSPDAGWLHLRIEERGISVVATLDADPQTAAESPVERLGTIDLVKYTQRGQRHSLTVQAQDSPDVTGEYCLSANLIVASDNNTLAAYQAFAAAGRASHRHDWQAAFDEYLKAALRFDRLQARRSSAAARYAMAEIAYVRIENPRDGYALTAEALSEYGADTEPFLLGGLVALQAKALLDLPNTEASVVATRVRELQQTAETYLKADAAGARELPRLGIITGFLEYRLDSPAKARALFSRTAQTCKALRDWDCYAIAGQNLGVSAYESRNYASAAAAFSEVLRLLPPGLDPKAAADIRTNYGIVQGRMGLFSGSERSYVTAMREHAQLGDCDGVRRNLSRSGNLLVQLGNLGDAFGYLQRAASVNCTGLLAAANRLGPAETLTAMPSDARTRDFYARDQQHMTWCSQALDPAGLSVDNKLTIFNSLVSLGDAFMLEGESQLAQRCVNAAEPYAASARTRMRLANARGEVLLETRDAAGAKSAFQQALKIADEAEIPSAYEYRGRAQLGIGKSALLAGDVTTVMHDGFAALRAGISRSDIDQTVISLRLLAAGYRELRQPEQAARTLQTAVDLIEVVPIDELDGEKRATYLATQYNVFAELTDLYASTAQTDPAVGATAFAVSERGRARSLRYAVTQTVRDADTAASQPAERYQQLLREVANLTATEAGAASPKLIEQLDAAALRERKSEDPLDQTQLRLTLRQLQATLVEYAVGTRDIFAFVFNESGLQVMRLGDRQVIASAAADLHDHLLDPEAPQRAVRESAQRLAQIVLWPLTAQLTSKRLIFVPDDSLHTIPFNVLPWSANPADLLLLQHAEVAIEPSALFLTRTHAAAIGRTPAARIALLGDPVFRVADWRQNCTEAREEPTSAGITREVSDWTESLPRLPGSRAEVQMIARLSQQSRPASHVEVLLGCAAVPSALRRAVSGHVDLLHIATHARVDSQRPRLSALALTPEQGSDGAASAFGLLDILGLKLTSSLVVLSACETSRGRLLPGEGVLGPAQAFLQAGAQAVVASYWRVDDLTTSKFMEAFYRYLLGERLPAATALRKAQIEQAQTSASHDWAAFALYGWPDNTL
jgi:CHAT domain-containing protein